MRTACDNFEACSQLFFLGGGGTDRKTNLEKVSVIGGGKDKIYWLEAKYAINTFRRKWD